MNNKSGHWSNKRHPVVEASLELTGSKNLSASKILSLVFDIYHPKSAADFGCGLGVWLAEAKKCGAETIRGYDIAEVDINSRRILPEEFIEADFQEEIKFEKKYDLAISLEVAEHIPFESADAYISTLTNASDIILFAAALPYQGGMGHVNENWLEYWASKFAKCEYECFDIIREKFWHDPSITYFYRQNTMMFVKKTISSEFKRQGFKPTSTPCSYIHPEMYIKAINRPRPSEKKQIYEDVRNYYKYSIEKQTKALEKDQTVFYGEDVLAIPKKASTFIRIKKRLKTIIK